MQLEKNGKKIEEIKILKTKVILKIEERKISINKDAYEQSILYVGKALTENEIRKLIELSSEYSSIAYVYRLLSRRPYSELEIKTRLYAKGVKSPQISSILKYFKDRKLIDDGAIKTELVEIGDVKNHGKLKTISELKHKGISVDENEFSEENEIQKVINQINHLNKMFTNNSYKMKLIKVEAKLRALGFEDDVIQRAMKSIPPKDLENELLNLKKDFKKAVVRLENKCGGKLLKQKVINSLMSKGYELNDIVNMWEETMYENDN